MRSMPLSPSGAGVVRWVPALVAAAGGVGGGAAGAGGAGGGCGLVAGGGDGGGGLFGGGVGGGGLFGGGVAVGVWHFDKQLKRVLARLSRGADQGLQDGRPRAWVGGWGGQ